jgi:hypothetical protein
LGKKKKKEREMRERNGGRSPLGGRLVGGGDIYDEQLFLTVVEKMSRGRPIFFLRPDVRCEALPFLQSRNPTVAQPIGIRDPVSTACQAANPCHCTDPLLRCLECSKLNDLINLQAQMRSVKHRLIMKKFIP